MYPSAMLAATSRANCCPATTSHTRGGALARPSAAAQGTLGLADHLGQVRCSLSRLAHGNASGQTHSETSSNYLCTNAARRCTAAATCRPPGARRAGRDALSARRAVGRRYDSTAHHHVWPRCGVPRAIEHMHNKPHMRVTANGVGDRDGQGAVSPDLRGPPGLLLCGLWARGSRCRQVMCNREPLISGSLLRRASVLWTASLARPVMRIDECPPAPPNGRAHGARRSW
jgi:hypothetical protein